MFDSPEEFHSIRKRAQARAYTRGATHEEAEDLVSDVLAYLIGRGAPVESLAPYLFRAVDRRLATLRKEKERRQEAETQHLLGQEAECLLAPIVPRRSLNSDGRPRRGGVDEIPCPSCGTHFKPYLISRNPERRQQTCGAEKCKSWLLRIRSEQQQRRGNRYRKADQVLAAA